MIGKELKEIASRIDDDTLILVDGMGILETEIVERVELDQNLVKNADSGDNVADYLTYHIDLLRFKTDAFRGARLDTEAYMGGLE